MIGWCTGCRKVKQVSVSGHALVMAQARRGVIQGVCADCEGKRKR
jgi:hypothetical protein